ncbi:hypothetical protein Tco_0040016, partial [Tanacetum coccineum]
TDIAKITRKRSKPGKHEHGNETPRTNDVHKSRKFLTKFNSDIVMSDSEDSTVTYTAVSSPFGGLSDIGSLGVDGPPMMPEDPYAYVVAAFQAPPSPDYVTGPKYPPSPEFVPEPAMFLCKDLDGGDDGDDEDELSDDDEDDDVNIKGDEDEEEHPAPADSTGVALPAVDHAPSVARLLAIPTPPPSPLSPWSSPLPQIPSPPLPPILSLLPVSSPLPSWLRAEALSTSHSPPLHIILSHTRANTPPSGTSPSGTPLILPILLPTSSPPLHLLSTDRRADRPEVTLPPQKRLDYAGSKERCRLWDHSDTWDEMLVDMSGAPVTDDTELGRRMTEFATRFRQDTDEIYVMSLRTTVLGQQAVITELQAVDHMRQAAITELSAADRRRQAQFIEALKLLKGLQTHMTEFQRQQGPAKGPAQPDALEEAGSSS